MGRLRRDADLICAHFGLRYRAIDPERANVKRRYGICYDDGSIKIRLRHARTGESLKYSSLVNTLCHELAHLRHFDHSQRFQAYYERLLGFARRQGIYLPGPRRAVPVTRPAAHARAALPTSATTGASQPGPVQLDLFA